MLLDAVTDYAIYRIDAGGRIVSWNRGGERLMGWTEQEVLGRSYADVFTEEGREAGEPERLLREAASRGRVEAQGWRVRKDESRFWADVVLTALHDRSGTVVGFAKVIRNVTERKVAQDRLRKLMETLPDAVLTVDTEGVVVFANERAAQLFGYDREGLVGSPIERFVPENARSRHRKLRARYTSAPRLREMGEGERQLKGRRQDGTLFPIEASLSPCSTPNGLLVTSVVRDITSRLELEAQLRHSQKMEALGQLTGGMAHDFNNILSAIITSGEMVLEGAPEDSEMQQDVEDLLSTARRGVQLVRRLLQFSRRGHLSMAPVRPAEVIHDLVAMLEHLLPETITLDVEDMTAPTDRVLADAGALEQILVNLCTNSRDAMPDGGPIRITSETTWLEEGCRAAHPWVTPGAFVTISVKDSGSGMDEETQQRLFEPFFTTKPVGQGSGLGMAMVYGLMKEHRGMVHVDSEVDSGTTVNLYLPLLTGTDV